MTHGNPCVKAIATDLGLDALDPWDLVRSHDAVDSVQEI